LAVIGVFGSVLRPRTRFRARHAAVSIPATVLFRLARKRAIEDRDAIEDRNDEENGARHARSAARQRPAQGYQATCERKAIASTVAPTEFDGDVRLALSISACT
jgi:hypothetical protein